jgi:hypothetical protein
MRYILNNTKTEWKVEPEEDDQDSIIESIKLIHGRAKDGKLFSHSDYNQTSEFIYKNEKKTEVEPEQNNLKLSTKAGDTVLKMPTSRNPKKEIENDVIIQQREIITEENKGSIGFDIKEIETTYDLTKLEAIVREGYSMSVCNFHRHRLYTSGEYNCRYQAKTKECSFDAEKMDNESKEYHSYVLQYIKNSVGNFAGPWDRPLSSNLRLGNTVKTFSEYTSWSHIPHNVHKVYRVDEEAHEELPTLKLIESLVEGETSIKTKIEGPCTEKYEHQYVYTCESRECKISCVCKLCNAEDPECDDHKVVEHNNTYKYHKHLSTVRNSDSASLHHLKPTFNEVGSFVKLSEDGMNKYCTDKSCRPENWTEYTYDKPAINSLKHQTQSGTKCQEFPFCKSVDIIKFGGIPKDCISCKDDLLSHEAYHLVPHRFCKFCEHILKEFEGTTDEKSFWENKLKVRTIIQCHICEDEFGDEKDRDKHIEYIHRREKQEVLKCDHCEFETVYKKSLNEHNDHIHCKDQMSVFKCDMCIFETTYQRNLNDHIRNVHKKDQQTKFQCDQCDYETVRKGDLKDHIKTIHEKEQQTKLQCDQCNYETVHKKHLNQHKRDTHKKTQQLQLQCYECDYSTVRVGDLNFHVKSQHTKKPKIELDCDKCDFKTDERKKLTQHVNRKHKHD